MPETTESNKDAEKRRSSAPCSPIVTVGRSLEFHDAEIYEAPRHTRLLLVVQTRGGDHSFIGHVTDDGDMEDQDGNDCGYTLDCLSYWSFYRSPYEQPRLPRANSQDHER